MADAGQELLIHLLEANMRQDKALFDQGIKVQAIELTLRSFPDAKPMYEEALERAKNPEVLAEFQRSQNLALAAIAAIRAGEFPSA